MKKNNKGYTLVELLVSIAIFAIVMLGIMSIMRSTSVLYQHGQQEVRLQEEAQIAVNQIEEILIDLDDRIYESNSTASQREYHIFKYDGTYGIKQSGDQLFFKKVASGGVISDANGWQLLAEGVEDFKITGIDYNGGGVRTTGDNRVAVSVSLKSGKYEYTAEKDVYFRNAIENETPFTQPEGSTSAGAGDANPFTHAYEVRRGEALDLFEEFGILTDVSLITFSSINPTVYYELINTPATGNMICDSNIIKVGSGVANILSEVPEDYMIGVQGKTEDGTVVKVQLTTKTACIIRDIEKFQFTVSGPTNAGSPKWVEFQGMDLSSDEITSYYSLWVYHDENGNGKYDEGTDSLRGSKAVDKAFGTNSNVLNYDSNSLVNSGYISAKINMGVKACENTGFLMVYQANDLCQNGEAFCADGKKYVHVEVTNFYRGSAIYGNFDLRLYAQGSGFAY